MFQYISDILKQFTSTQKILALIILLISVVSISYITMITRSPEEMVKTISIQRDDIIKNQKYISELSCRINSLNDSIMKMNQDCNDKAIHREKVYMNKMIEQQQYINSIIDNIKLIMENRERNIKPIRIDTTDSVFTAHSPIIIIDDVNDNVDSEIINNLNKIKKKINK